jgi:hypothetical protein
MGPVLFAVASAALAVLAARLAERLLPGARRADRLLATLLVFVAACCGVLLALGTAGLLSAGPIALSSVAALVCELALSARERRAPSRAAPAAPSEVRHSSFAERAGVALVCGVLVWWASLTLGSGASFIWDDLAYHATLPAWWTRAGSLALMPLNYQGYYPANAELFALWFVAPFETDALGNAGVLVWLALLALGFVAIARAHEVPLLPVALVLTCFVLSPEVALFAQSYCANDLAQTAFAVAMLAFAAAGDERHVSARATLSGIAAGLALGTKITVAPQVALVALWWGTRKPVHASRWRLLALFVVAAVLCGGFWFARNWLVAGNPVYPAEFGPFEGPFSAEVQRRTTLIPTILENWTRPQFWQRFAFRRLDWPLALGLLSLCGYAFALALLARADELRRRRYWLLLSVAGIALLALFPFQPFSGTNNRPSSGLHHPIRFLTLQFALGLLLFASAFKGAGKLRALMMVVVVLLALLAADGNFAGHAAWLAGGFVVALLAVYVAEQRRTPWPAWLGTLALVAPWPLLALAAPALERAAAARLYAFGGERPMGAPWRVLEQLPDGARIATITNDPGSHALYRPLFGRSLRFQPVAVDALGRAELAWHERGSNARGWWDDFGAPPPPSAEDLLRNLAQARVDFLLLSKWPAFPTDKQGLRVAPWPPAKQAFEHVVGARCLHADGYSELWDLREAAAEPNEQR